MDQNDYELQVIAGRNPVLEALSSDKTIDCIYLQTSEHGGPLGRIASIAKEKGIPVKEVSPTKLHYLCGSDNHQGVVATLAASFYSEMADIYAKAGDHPLFVVLCDGIEDPHNLGAIIRTAEAAGAHGVIIPKRHSVGLTPVTAKSSAGAIMHLPIVRVPNLACIIDELKEKGVWFYCADMDGEDYSQVDFSGAVGLVVGSEGEGVSHLIKSKCDRIVSLPMKGKVNSLNASVAAGILLYEITKSR